MKIETKRQFQEYVKSFNISTEFIVVKPNWVSNTVGRYTDPEMLTWLLECFRSDQCIIILESYTPWRGVECPEINDVNDIGVGLVSGKAHWKMYQMQDDNYLRDTHLQGVLDRFHAQYLNITSAYWDRKCCSPASIAHEMNRRSFDITFKEFCSYVPTHIYEIRDRATFVSLAKIKLQIENPPIYMSLSLKNVFGLIPHPARMNPYHGEDHTRTPIAIADINKVYASLFQQSVWINDGMKSVIHHYCSEHERIEHDTGLLFVSRNPIQADTEACLACEVDPKDVPYLRLLTGVWKV